MANKPGPKPKPPVTAFALISKMDRGFRVWHAVALRIQGREVVDEKVMETDDSLQVAADVMERRMFEFTRYNVDPFAEVER